jgi:hypothetical protein
MTTIDNQYLVKTSNIFTCELCNYNTCRKYNLELHNESMKHKNNILAIKNNENLVIVSKTHICENCNKIFGDRSGLWRHKKKCIIPQKEEITSNELHLQNIELQKQNIELQKQILEICKNLQPSTINNTMNNCHNNSNNKTFNLHFFLNETCKNAMNISEFIENISLQLSDLENIGKIGYVEGVSDIIIKNLNALEVEKRPMHCTDKKREIIYVKDADEWQKEEENKKRVRQVISGVVSKHLNMLPEFQNKYPDYLKPDSKKSDEYNQIIMETMGGAQGNGEKNKEKIIRKIVKEVTIEKEY